MSKHFLFSFCAVILLSSCTKNEPKTFSISGTVSPAGVTNILLQQETDIEQKISTPIDTIQVDSKGNFKASYNLEPDLYSLVLPNKSTVALAINKDQDISVSIDNYNEENETVSVQGSKDTDALIAYENFRKESLARLVESIRKQVVAVRASEQPDEAKIIALEQQEIENYQKHLAELNQYIQKNISTTIGLYATSIRWKGAENLALFDSLTTNYENAYPNLAISAKLREKVTRLQQTSVGGQAKNIVMNTANGESKSLNSLKAKYILIDFWASWCGPCRTESVSLNELYKKYDREQFDIYGVSLDDKREKWLSAIEKDHRVWTNVSSLELFKTPAAYDYAVTALPGNFLIDANGKIVAKDLHGEDLEIALNSLLSTSEN
tara:strand:- start:90031 stop:91170 length:1140 start_codon:yes stop_codon:yes gene_type:complete